MTPSSVSKYFPLLSLLQLSLLKLEMRPAIYLLLENSQTFRSELHQLIPQFL